MHPRRPPYGSRCSPTRSPVPRPPTRWFRRCRRPLPDCRRLRCRSRPGPLRGLRRHTEQRSSPDASLLECRAGLVRGLLGGERRRRPRVQYLFGVDGQGSVEGTEEEPDAAAIHAEVSPPVVPQRGHVDARLGVPIQRHGDEHISFQRENRTADIGPNHAQLVIAADQFPTSQVSTCKVQGRIPHGVERNRVGAPRQGGIGGIGARSRRPFGESLPHFAILRYSEVSACRELPPPPASRRSRSLTDCIHV